VTCAEPHAAGSIRRPIVPVVVTGGRWRAGGGGGTYRVFTAPVDGDRARYQSMRVVVQWLTDAAPGPSGAASPTLRATAEVPCDDRPCDLVAVSFGADGPATLSVADTPNLWRRTRHRTFALVAPGDVRVMRGS
jgi:hypothetical protein